MDPSKVVDAVEKQVKVEKNEEHMESMMSKINTLIRQNEDQNNKIDKLSKQNDELKDMMVDMQNNPRLMIICNKLYPIEQLNLSEPQFKPVLEILDKELPEYANLANNKTGVVHAKAVQKINTIKPTAVEEGGDIFYKTENVLSKDNGHITTKAFIDAIGALGYEYAQKAIGDLKSERECDKPFQHEVLNHAANNSLPNIDDVLI